LKNRKRPRAAFQKELMSRFWHSQRTTLCIRSCCFS